MNVLHVDSSILGEQSASRTLTREIVARLAAQQPDTTVHHLDLAVQELPHLSGPSLTRNDAAQAAHDAELLEQFLAADVIVIGAPMYNFSIPSQLKAWIDRIAVAGKTFRYTPEGPEGLAGGKHVIVALSRGGIYAPGAPGEFVESYLTFVLGFLGIRSVSFVRAEGLAISPQRRREALDGAIASIGARLADAA
jgi:FMN-dependent NADH-azoreductase